MSQSVGTALMAPPLVSATPFMVQYETVPMVASCRRMSALPERSPPCYRYPLTFNTPVQLYPGSEKLKDAVLPACSWLPLAAMYTLR